MFLKAILLGCGREVLLMFGIFFCKKCLDFPKSLGGARKKDYAGIMLLQRDQTCAKLTVELQARELWPLSTVKNFAAMLIDCPQPTTWSFRN